MKIKGKFLTDDMPVVENRIDGFRDPEAGLRRQFQVLYSEG